MVDRGSGKSRIWKIYSDGYRSLWSDEVETSASVVHHDGSAAVCQDDSVSCVRLDMHTERKDSWSKTRSFTMFYTGLTMWVSSLDIMFHAAWKTWPRMLHVLNAPHLPRKLPLASFPKTPGTSIYIAQRMSPKTKCTHLLCAEHVLDTYCFRKLPLASKRTLHEAFTLRKTCPRMPMLHHDCSAK